MFSKDFLDAAEDVAKTVTATNGSEFTSNHLSIPGGAKYGTIMVTFTRAAGDGEDIEFHFQVSCDHGATWSTHDYFHIKIDSDAPADTNVVRAAKQISFLGEFTNIRLALIINNDVSNDITAANATLHIGAS